MIKLMVPINQLEMRSFLAIDLHRLLFGRKSRMSVHTYDSTEFMSLSGEGCYQGIAKGHTEDSQVHNQICFPQFF